MANQSSKAKAKADHKLIKAGKRSDFHGQSAFRAPDVARTFASPRSWKATKRHPTNIAIGQRKIGDSINTGTTAKLQTADVSFVKASPFNK